MGHHDSYGRSTSVGEHGHVGETADGVEEQLGQRTLIAFNRALTHWSSRGRPWRAPGPSCVRAGPGSPWSPTAPSGSDDALQGSALVAAADAFFGALGRGFTVKVRDSGEDDDLRAACLEAGLELFGDPVPEMICRTPLPDAPRRGGHHRAGGSDDEAGVRDFIA